MSWGVTFEDFECPNDAQAPCWLRLWPWVLYTAAYKITWLWWRADPCRPWASDTSGGRRPDGVCWLVNLSAPPGGRSGHYTRTAQTDTAAGRHQLRISKLLHLTLPMLRLHSPKAQERKNLWKPSKPCHVGIHWIALTEYSQMSTHLPGFRWFFRILALYHIGKISHHQHEG